MLVFLVAGLVLFVAIVELVAAVLPMLVVILCVPPEERAALAEVIAAADSSRKLRLWSALRVAVVARRERRRARRVAPSRHEMIASVATGAAHDQGAREPYW